MNFVSIISANLIEKNGKKLYINNFAGKKEDILIISKSLKQKTFIKNAVRITTTQIANSINLKKFIPILERDKISVGSFLVEADFSINKGEFNPIIDETLYFFSEVPELEILDYSKMKLVFDSSQIFENEKKVVDFIKKAKFSEVVITGKKSDFWFKKIKKIVVKTKIVYDNSQTNLF